MAFMHWEDMMGNTFYHQLKSNSIKRYDAQNNKWCFRKPMINERCTFTALIGPDCRNIYAIGGYNGNAMNSTELYDPSRDCWEQCPPMKNKRYMHGAAICGVHSNE